MGRVELPSRVYESLVLTIELHRHLNVVSSITEDLNYSSL